MKKSEIIAKLTAQLDESGDVEMTSADLASLVPVSSEEQSKRGFLLAEVLGLRKDTEHKDRFKTSWGSKTPIGLFATVERIILEGQ